MARGKKLSRKRKLPADLAEAESLVHSANTANEAVTSVHQQLRNTIPQLIDGRADALSPESLATWLVAKYGVEEIQKLVSIIAALPTSLPSSKKEYYFKHLSGREIDGEFLMEIIEKSSFANKLSSFKPSIPSIIAPPTSQCYQCGSTLVENHNCRVKLYTMCGMEEAQKVTLRRKKCSLTYNYNMWGNKSRNGFIYYDKPADYVEVNDKTYFVRSLLNLQSSLANHAWVSFQGFAESYNDTYSLPKEAGL
jgi:hypothetical protein